MENFDIIQKVIRISHLALAMSARDTMREMVKVLIQEFHMDPTRVLGYSHDCSSVNTLAMETMELIFFRAEDWPCFSHTLDHVGDQFVHIHIDGFWHLWMNIFAHGKKTSSNMLHRAHWASSSEIFYHSMVVQI